MSVVFVRITVFLILLFSLSRVSAEALVDDLKTSAQSKEINLLAGLGSEKALPAGWMLAADNMACKIDFNPGEIYFERESESEKCSFFYSKNFENGHYLLRTEFKIDGNEPKIFLDGDALVKSTKLKVTNGILKIGIQVRGSGKVWGRISSMTLARVQQ